MIRWKIKSNVNKAPVTTAAARQGGLAAGPGRRCCRYCGISFVIYTDFCSDSPPPHPQLLSTRTPFQTPFIASCYFRLPPHHHHHHHPPTPHPPPPPPLPHPNKSMCFG